MVVVDTTAIGFRERGCSRNNSLNSNNSNSSCKSSAISNSAELSPAPVLSRHYRAAATGTVHLTRDRMGFQALGPAEGVGVKGPAVAAEEAAGRRLSGGGR